MVERTGTRRKQETGRPPRADDPKDFSVSVGEAIRRGRQTRGWTQVQLAEAASLSPNYIARLERGEVGPSLFVAQQICEALGIDVSALLRPEAPAQSAQRTGRRSIAG